MHTPALRLAALLCATAAATAAAQEIPPPIPESTPKQPIPKEPAPKAEPAQPSLDDLLGIPNAKPAKPDAKPRPEAADPTRTELDRRLSAREVAEQFKQAVDLMGDTADRIQVSRDTGLATQRLQEDIIRKLDQLIKAAEQNQQEQQSRSSRSQGQRDQSQQQPSQQQGQQRTPDGNEAAPDSAEPPAGQDARPNAGAAARGAAWGNLPTRVRDALLQGNADKYSSWYQQWTEAYYKRLAEDAGK